MVDSYLHRRPGRTPVERMRLAATGLLLVGATTPALSLAILDQLPKAVTAPAIAFLLVSLPLACVLLAVLLWQARRRIVALERDRTAIGTSGIDPLTTLPDRLRFDQVLDAAIAGSGADAPVALVALEVGHVEPVFGQLEHLRQQFPGPGNGVLFEIVAKAPVAQHLKHRVVVGVVAYLLQVVVLAADAQALLGYRQCACRARAYCPGSNP